ncbi:MAG TPA: acyloxyacyl hydrolase [Stellaceae bacterium]|nr:acyloxyacyl hydrolase [Stellaceae bacterium]
MRGWFSRVALAAAVIGTMAVASTEANAEIAGLVAGGLGAFDFLHNYTAAEGRLEFRFAQSFFYWKPLIGAYFTDRGSVYTYGGFRLELPVGRHILIVPMATVGDYEQGNGKDLGAHIEFKTGAEIDLVFANGVRVGPVFDHVSNAGIGRRNPGEENLLLMVSVPLGIVTP